MSRRCTGAAEVLDGVSAALPLARSSQEPSPAARLTAMATMAAGPTTAATDIRAMATVMVMRRPITAMVQPMLIRATIGLTARISALVTATTGRITGTITARIGDRSNGRTRSPQGGDAEVVWGLLDASGPIGLRALNPVMRDDEPAMPARDNPDADRDDDRALDAPFERSRAHGSAIVLARSNSDRPGPPHVR